MYGRQRKEHITGGEGREEEEIELDLGFWEGVVIYVFGIW